MIPVPNVLAAQTSWEQGQSAGPPRQPFYWLGSDTPCTSLSLGREERGPPGAGRKRKQKLPNAFHNALVSTPAGTASGETLGPLWTGFLRRKSFSLKTTRDQSKAKLAAARKEQAHPRTKPSKTQDVSKKLILTPNRANHHSWFHVSTPQFFHLTLTDTLLLRDTVFPPNETSEISPTSLNIHSLSPQTSIFKGCTIISPREYITVFPLLDL